MSLKNVTRVWRNTEKPRIINYYMDWNPLYNRVKLFVTILVSPRTQTVQVTVFVVSYIVFCCNASV